MLRKKGGPPKSQREKCGRAFTRKRIRSPSFFTKKKMKIFASGSPLLPRDRMRSSPFEQGSAMSFLLLFTRGKLQNIATTTLKAFVGGFCNSPRVTKNPFFLGDGPHLAPSDQKILLMCSFCWKLEVLTKKIK